MNYLPQRNARVLIAILGGSLLVWGLWWAFIAFVWMEIPADLREEAQIAQASSEQTTARIWSERSAFGDMFGGLNALLTSLNFGILAFAMLMQYRETRRQNEIDRWRTNYDYLLEAKKLIAQDSKILRLHGLPDNLAKSLNASHEEIAYVVLDLKAADLFYRMSADTTFELTDYRRNLLDNPHYRRIALPCVQSALIPDGQFRTRILKYMEDAEKRAQESARTIQGQE